jgi:serine/threonine protein kinase
MNKTTALARLGLTGEEDASTITRAYGERLSTVQSKLIAALTDAEREQEHSALSGLVEAYEFLTSTGRYTNVSAGHTVARAVHDTAVRMETGSIISDRLEIGEMLGQGGMGYVYAARDRLRNEDVAIKVLRQDLLFSSAAKERFLAEARVSSNLSHPNIVRVYDVGESGGHYYLSMERLKGQTLRQRMQAYQRDNRAFTVAEVTEVARQLVDALRYAHRYIVHRDLKPENVWLADDGTVKLMDFGIARAFSNSNMTHTGMTLGTAYYMAPEQRADAKDVDWRADQYALGVVMYEMLVGSVPMGAVSSLNATRRDVPQRVANAIMRAISPQPNDRWASLDALLAELQTPKRTSSRAAVWIVGVLVAAAAGAGVYYSGALMPVATQTTNAPRMERMNADVQVQAPSEAPAERAPADQSVPPPPADSETKIAAVIEPETSPPAATSTQLDTAAQAPSQPKASGGAIKTAAIDPAAQRRQECMAQCERDDGECRSINRRGKQDCMRAVGFGSTGNFTTSPNANVARCAFYTQARCRYAMNRDACLARIGSRYNECVNVLTGSVVSRRQDCDDQSREADSLCLNELRDCRSYCE